ncbi:anti-sigma factor [Arthrobacter sp. B10-11]|uniref:anti-sigma factor n=1 Tax=Arthrobacter sp. B10-11 TaxID=3081160 RepID=UPI002953EFB8|nr:anti-sigma factor [Arthrobacter sp. B10-11]MDV8146603.1 anti-sigma factor [Arthrobacter sp. B10-11]
MGQLRKLLRGLGGNCTRGLLPRSKRGRSTKHTESCPECTSRQWRERQYLERMRRASIPAASDDFTARLLARTQQLAMETGGTSAANAAPRNTSTGSPAMRALGLVAGGAVAAAGMVSAAAYFVAGDPMPVAEASSPRSAQQQEAAFGLQASAADPSLGATAMLTAADLEGLRARGWSCPELRDMGFHVLWARREAVAGQPVLELRLTDGKHFATVLEQHSQPVAAGAAPLAVRSSSPTNILTGRPAADDGFVQAPGGPGAPAGGAGALWVNTSAPWRAIYTAPGVTLTYVSDLPADSADDGVAELVRAGSGTPLSGVESPAAGGSAAAGPEQLTARLQRGLGRIVELFTP